MAMELDIVRTSSFMDSVDSFGMAETTLGDYLSYASEDTVPSPSFGSIPLSSSSLDFQGLQLSPLMESYTYSSNYTAEPASISPPTLTYHLSGGEMSSDDTASSRRSRAGNSPSPVPYSATVPRSHRFNPISVPPTRASARAAAKRRATKESHDSDAEEEEDYHPGPNDPRREAVRRQRIESEQRRRDELRDGYSRLKSVLPPSSAKSSKVNLLDRAATHLKHLETCKQQAEQRLKIVEAELNRVRNLNEVLSLRAVQQREGAMGVSAAPTSY